MLLTDNKYCAPVVSLAPLHFSDGCWVGGEDVVEWLLSKDLPCHGGFPPSRALMQGCARAKLLQASWGKSMQAWFPTSDIHLAVFSKYNPIRVGIFATSVCIIVYSGDLISTNSLYTSFVKCGIPLKISQGLEDAYLMRPKVPH